MTDTPRQPETAGSRPIAILGGVAIALGGLVGTSAGVLSATGGAWTRPDTFVVFFGVCSLVAALLGAAVILGKVRATIGMTLLIASGMLLVGGALSEPQLVAGALGQAGGEFRSYHGVLLKHLMLAQLALAGVGFALCALQVWSRDVSKTLPLVARSAIAFALLGALGVCAVVPSVRAQITGLPQVLTAIVVVLGGLFAIVLTAAGGHTLIRSFEVTKDA